MGVAIKPNKFKSFLRKNYWDIKNSGNNENKANFAKRLKINDKLELRTGKIMFGSHRSEMSVDALKRANAQFENILKTQIDFKDFLEFIKNNTRIIELPK